MMGNLRIFVNEQFIYEHDCSSPFDQKQLEFLDKMDRDMDRGLKMYGELISKPDTKQKATFIALNLLKALKLEDHARITSSCAFLHSRMPQVVEIHARDTDNRIAIEFIEQH